MKICGIDEAGRGALAGCMAIAACVLLKPVCGLNDSKKLTAKRREELYKQIITNSKFLIVYFSNEQIDEFGLSQCLKRALNLFKDYFKDFELIYDGNANYGTGIKTIIKADSKIAEVSAASILAKVSRDKLMCAWDKIYPNFGFKTHKGYGTKAHIESIFAFGNSPLHRKSFIIKPKQNTLF
ncbi:MAG: ribonuclease HII [Campylobacter sp.]